MINNTQIQSGSLVYMTNDKSKHPYLVHDVINDNVSLGIKEYPDVEQDYYIDINDVKLFNDSELVKAQEIINKLF